MRDPRDERGADDDDESTSDTDRLPLDPDVEVRPATTQVVDAKCGPVTLHERSGSNAVLPEQRYEEGERTHEEGGVLQETLTFTEVFVDETKFPLLQISKSAVDHFRRLRTRAARDVAGVNESHL